MKYAVISDVHGNYPALEAALADAGASDADMYLFLGDYATNFPWGNEVVDAVRRTRPKIVIRGNGEGYLADLKKVDQRYWTKEQWKPAYWAYRSLSAENLEYLLSLRESAGITDGSYTIHLSHSVDLFYNTPGVDVFLSSAFREMMETGPFSHAEYLVRAKNAITSNADALAGIASLPPGIYLFGHNHMQFYLENEGRLFINPGSCGEALDLNTTAAYTLLDCMGDQLTVTERRVAYDLTAVADGLRSSGFSEYAPVWSDIMERELYTGKDYYHPFVMHLIATANELGCEEYPVRNDVWDKAVKTWRPTE